MSEEYEPNPEMLNVAIGYIVPPKQKDDEVIRLLRSIARDVTDIRLRRR